MIKERSLQFLEYTPATGVDHLGLLVHGLTTVLELLDAVISSSTLQAFMERRLQEGKVLLRRKVKPMKVNLMYLVSLHSKLTRATPLFKGYLLEVALGSWCSCSRSF